MADIFKWSKWLGGLVLLIISLPGIPGDIDGWQSWISALRGLGWLTESVLRWGLFIAGASLLVWVNYPVIKTRSKGLCAMLMAEKNNPIPKPSPLRIEFDGDVRSLTETHPIFPSNQVKRWCYCVRVLNSGSKDISKVALEVEKIEQIPNRQGEELIPFPSYLGLIFPFKVNGEPSRDFAPNFSAHLPLISHVNSPSLSTILKIESTPKHEFPHNNRRHRIHTKVTGSKVPSVERRFIVWVNDSGTMKMIAE